MAERDLYCPHDKAKLAKKVVEEATLDVCGKCGGQFFDSGEMFRAFGIKADPSYWDRPETGGEIKGNSKIGCPQCVIPLVIQDVKYDGDHVEIDRCGKCGGVWLDKGEIEKIIAIGDKLQPVLDAETAKAKEELDKLGEVDFAPGLISRFLKMFRK